MVEVMKIMVTSFKRAHAGTASLSVPNLAEATYNPRLCQRLLDPHGQVWVSLFGVTAPFSWVLVHNVLFVPSKSLFPPSCINSGSSMVRLMVTSSKRAYAIPMSAAPIPMSAAPCNRPLLTRTSTGDTKHSSISVSVGSLGPGVHKVCLSPLSVC